MAEQKNIRQLKGVKDYQLWKIQIESMLLEKGLLKESKDETSYPAKEEEKTIITDKEIKIKGIILQTICDTIALNIDWQERPSKILKHLDNIYNQRLNNLSKVIAIETKMCNLKYKSGDLMKHLEVFESFINDMKVAGDDCDDKRKIAKLLNTLPEEYNPLFISLKNISYQEAIQTILDYQQTLRRGQEPVVLAVESAKPAPTTARNHFQPRPYRGKFNSRGRGSFRGRRGSYHGRQDYNKAKFNGRCYICSKYGHKKSECRFKRNKENKVPDKERSVNQVDGYTYMVGSASVSPFQFLLDSGSTEHITGIEELARGFKQLNSPLYLQTAKQGEFIIATRKGNLTGITNTGVVITIPDVLYVPNASKNIISSGRLRQHNFQFIEMNGEVIVKDPQGRMVVHDRSGQILIYMHIQPMNSVNMVVGNNKYNLWHNRLGHMSKDKFNEMKRHNMAQDIEIIRNVHSDNNLCEPCIMGKQCRKPFNASKERKINRPIFEIHSDVAEIPNSIDNKKYYVTFIDRFSHYCAVYLMSNKSEVFHHFKDYKAKVEALFKDKIIYLYCDNGGEYLSKEMMDFLFGEWNNLSFDCPKNA